MSLRTLKRSIGQRFRFTLSGAPQAQFNGRTVEWFDEEVLGKLIAVDRTGDGFVNVEAGGQILRIPRSILLDAIPDP